MVDDGGMATEWLNLSNGRVNLAHVVQVVIENGRIFIHLTRGGPISCEGKDFDHILKTLLSHCKQGPPQAIQALNRKQ